MPYWQKTYNFIMSNQFDKFFSEEIMGAAEVFPIISLDERSQDIQLEEGAVLPILPLRNMVIFPGVLMPVAVARPKSLKLIRYAHENEKLIGVCSQVDKKLEDPNINQLYEIGTAAQIVRILEMPDGTTTVILEGKLRFKLGEVVSTKPYMKARVSPLVDILPDDKNLTVFFLHWSPPSKIWQPKSLSIQVCFPETTLPYAILKVLLLN